MTEGEGKGKGDSRSSFDLRLFMHRRANTMGDTKALLEFLKEFQDSQMFERFCAYRLTVMTASKAWSGVVENPHEDADDFSAAVAELRSKGLAATVMNVKVLHTMALTSLHFASLYLCFTSLYCTPLHFTLPLLHFTSLHSPA